MKIHPYLADKTRRLVAGHRGMRAVYPENTLFSFEMAMRLGVDMLETDVRTTRDGELILMHDDTLDRTTNGTGPVADKTLAEIKQLCAGMSEGERLEVPTLREFCELISRHWSILLNVEIKQRTADCADRTVEMLARYGLVENCVFACFDADIIKHIHLAHDLPCQGFPGFAMTHFEPGLDGTLRHMAAAGIEMHDLTPERVRDYEEIGVLPWAYCPDDEQAAAKALYCGARLVTSNNPEPCLRVFRKAPHG